MKVVWTRIGNVANSKKIFDLPISVSGARKIVEVHADTKKEAEAIAKKNGYKTAGLRLATY
jgi:hypothetical protein